MRTFAITLYLCLSTAFASAALFGWQLTTSHRTEDDAEFQALLQRLDGLSERLEKLQSPTAFIGEPKAPVAKDAPLPSDFFAENAATLGNDDAPVTIVAFMDYQCPFCKRARHTLDRIHENYPNDVRILFKHMPLAFHKDAKRRAVFAECAHQQNAFFEIDAFLYEQQSTKTLDFGSLNLNDAKGCAAIDHHALMRCTQEEQTLQRVKDHMAEAQVAGVQGTPNFFINGQKLTGAQPYESFQKMIDDALLESDKVH